MQDLTPRLDPVDYDSPEFEAGLADGLAGRPCAQPKHASYYEGWLMGDCERFCASRE